MNEGTIDVDQAALTGESLPVTMLENDECRMGSTVARGETEATVTGTGLYYFQSFLPLFFSPSTLFYTNYSGSNTFFGKTATMLNAENEMSNFQKMLLSIVSILVVISVSLSIATFWYLDTIHTNVKDNLSFVVVLIVASIPMAVEIVTTTTLAVGSKQLAKV